jgi:hypothetical protein
MLLLGAAMFSSDHGVRKRSRFAFGQAVACRVCHLEAGVEPQVVGVVGQRWGSKALGLSSDRGYRSARICHRVMPERAPRTALLH